VGHTTRTRYACVWLATCGLELGFVAALHGQAWVPPKGEGTVSLTYQNYYVTGHFDRVGNRNKNGATHTKALAAELDYGVTDTVGLSVSLPFIASKYTGSSSYFVEGRATFPGPLDDGSYHATFQDFRVELRRLLLAGPVAIAPFVGASFPTHDYETVGEAVPGRHRRELQLGASAGVALDPILPGVYLHVRYAFAAAERVQGFPAVRSNIELEGGRAVSSRVALRGVATWQIKHKGPRPTELFDDWVNHDRFIVGSFFNLGGGTTVSLTRSTEVHATWIATLSGTGGGHVARLFAIGATWSFGGTFEGFGSPSSERHRE
jgi:hypothetical protein